jgi:hypothetical protein
LLVIQQWSNGSDENAAGADPDYRVSTPEEGSQVLSCARIANVSTLNGFRAMNLRIMSQGVS